ncbi:MAG TPA: hypothetical protein VE693_08465 [Gaiellaceae bacterium]|nr:hypothetical protein [Gaiellaceae bacterium]
MSEPRFDPKPLLNALQRHDVDFIVVGAAAAISQGSPLPTYDLDVTPARDPQNIERIVAALVDLDAKLRTPAEPVPFPIDARMLARGEAWTLDTRFGSLDLVFAPAGTQGYDDLRRDALLVDLGTDRPVLVASIRDVIRMKEASAREKDRMQLPALRRTLDVIRRREHEA